MPIPLALLSWLLVGLLAGLLAAWLLPGQPPRRFLFEPLAGLLGALSGGLLATVLGFGGLVGYDHRSLATATLGAMLLLLLFRSWRLSSI